MLFVAAVALGAAGVASADKDHGMCTAYFNGSQTGQEHKRQANAFQEFVNYVGDNDGVDNDGDGETDEGDEVATPTEVWDFCEGNVGGNPDDPNTEENEGNGNHGRGNG